MATPTSTPINGRRIDLGRDRRQPAVRFEPNVSNALDQTTAGDLGYPFADYYDQIGRRFQVAVTSHF